MTHNEFTESLRLVADFYDEHPEVLLPYMGGDGELVLWCARKDFPIIARAFGSAKKEVTDSFFWLKKTFGHITLAAGERRELVCTRRVIDTRIIPAHTIPERVLPAEEIPERAVEQVVWDCPDSILEMEAKN